MGKRTNNPFFEFKNNLTAVLAQPISAGMMGPFTVYTDAPLTNWPSVGAFTIGVERFHYTGILGNNFTGVTGARDGTTSDNHVEGDLIIQCPAVEQWNSVAESPIGGFFVYQDTEVEGLTIGVTAGTIVLGGKPFNYMGTTGIALTPSAINYVELYIDASDAVQIAVNTTGFSRYRFPLAEITTSLSDITSIIDRRGWSETPGDMRDALYTTPVPTSAPVIISASLTADLIYFQKLHFNGINVFNGVSLKFPVQLADPPRGGMISVALYYRDAGGDLIFMPDSNIDEINIDALGSAGSVQMVTATFPSPIEIRSDYQNQREWFAAIQVNGAFLIGNYVLIAMQGINTVAIAEDAAMYPVLRESAAHGGGITYWPTPVSPVTSDKCFFMKLV